MLTTRAPRGQAVLCLCTLLLLAALCPVTQAKKGGLGGFFKGKASKKDGDEGRSNAPAPPPKKSPLSPKQGLKLAGAAAAGALGGYGLGSWGRTGHHGSRGKKDYQRDGQGGRSGVRAKSSAPAAQGDRRLWTLGSVMLCLAVDWTRGL